MTCRHCWSEQHLIEHCPDVVSAFGPVRPSRNHPAQPLPLLTCPQCGAEFKRKFPLQKYCGRACYKAAQVGLAHKRGLRSAAHQRAQARTCIVCGVSIAGEWSGAKTCPNCRDQYRMEQGRAYARRKYAERRAEMEAEK